MIDKAPHGTPCNGCGRCCLEEPCVLGSLVTEKLTGECPALQWRDEHACCGLVATPADYSPFRAHLVGAQLLSEAAMVLTGSGIGCDSHFDGEKKNHAFLKHLRRMQTRYADLMNDALALWGFRVGTANARSVEIRRAR